MRILPVKFYKPVFKAHSYKIEPKNCEIIIQTDNNPNLGENPYLIYEHFGKQEVEMNSENGLYSASAYSVPWAKDFKYHILYKDTGALDLKDGEDYSINFDGLRMDAIAAIRKQHRQPIVHSFKSGSAVGKLLYKDRIEYNEIENNIEEPSIIVCKSLLTGYINNPNVVGLILLSDDMSTLSHSGSMLRNSTKVCAAVYDTNIIKQLQTLDGENIEIEVKNDYINFSKSNKISTQMTYPRIKVPELKYSDKILTSDEYMPDLVGAKAVNLRRLENLVNEGKIDVKIAKSAALTYGYIQKLFAENQENVETTFTPEIRMLDLIETLKKNGFSNNIIVRSAFNGEDLPNYSAAGLYTSYPAELKPDSLYDMIMGVAQSKWNPIAVIAREKYGISDEVIHPTVIIQNEIKPDYKFTLYTDYEDNKMRIELFSDKLWLFGDTQQPNVFTYDKNTGELTYDSVQLAEPYVFYDKNLNMKALPPLEYNLSDRPEVFELVQKLVDNALVIEKEFGHPQDIEGGFAGNDVYLWQTRNIIS